MNIEKQKAKLEKLEQIQNKQPIIIGHERPVIIMVKALISNFRKRKIKKLKRKIKRA